MLFLKRFFAISFAFFVVNKIKRSFSKAPELQKKTLKNLIKKSKNTSFGIEHKFHLIKNHEDFVRRVPVRDYEQIKKYIARIKKGELNVLWPGKPKYLAKTSGTTSGIKQIPITNDSMPNHILSARNALLFYIYETRKTKFLNGKTIFIQGTPTLRGINGILEGRLSGIVAHHVPKYLRKNNLPTLKTNSIEDWELKVDQICQETINENMTVIGGIPSWVQMYFEKIKTKTNKSIIKVFPNFSLFIHGGVNFEPYKTMFKNMIGKTVDSIELYPASEGFFAYQDNFNEDGLLLLLNSGIFYEFIDADKFFDDDAKRITIKDVKLGVNYVIILSTNAGLWSYNIGDTIRFVSTRPYRIVVTGRIKHFISAFGEHVIAKEVETALKKVIDLTPIQIREFTVAPQVNPSSGLPYHEWLIDFKIPPKDINKFSDKLDYEMRNQNIYYEDLINGKVLRPLLVSIVENNGFEAYMKRIGKLGGQNKVPRLSNNRKIADNLKIKNE